MKANRHMRRRLAAMYRQGKLPVKQPLAHGTARINGVEQPVTITSVKIAGKNFEMPSLITPPVSETTTKVRTYETIADALDAEFPGVHV